MTKINKNRTDDLLLWAGHDFELLGSPGDFVMFTLGPANPDHHVEIFEYPQSLVEEEDGEEPMDLESLEDALLLRQASLEPPGSPGGAGKTEPGADDVELPPVVPILPVDNLVIFPHMIAPLTLDSEEEKQLVDEALKAERFVGVFTTKPGLEDDSDEAPTKNQFKRLHPVGTVCVVLRMLRVPDGTMRLLVHGITRARLEEPVAESPYLKARLTPLPEEEPKPEKAMEIQAMRKTALSQLQKIIEISSLSEELGVAANNVEEPGKLADLIASNIQLRTEELLEILGKTNVKDRFKRVLYYLSRELQVLELGSHIQSQVKTEIDKNQRQYVLREQMKAIRQELGEEEPHEKEMKELRERLEKKPLPDHARAVVEKELGRLAQMQPASAEYGVIRTYVEWFFDLPWLESTEENIDIQRAKKVLDEDHYGLQKVKERILEFLAVLRLRKSMKGPILCFVGPPGVGKTSLGRSIARATGRRFTRFSLGGMRDEAEIRGHRRTYIGAMPGRIIKAMKECAANNPLIMLDEVDKLGMDFRGDPASALLEVLDPEQNNTFQDHYLDVPFDLSRAMFITTANHLEPVPGPLRDRMEIIELAGYTENEKLAIAQQYLVPREMLANGLRKSELKFTKSGLAEIIEKYTREAGVRSLQRQIGSIARKTARRVAENLGPEEIKPARGKGRKKGAETRKKPDRQEETRTMEKSAQTSNPVAVQIVEGGKPKVPGGKARIKSITISQQNVREFLGPPKAYTEMAQRMGQPGVAIGMAWTPTGGEILFIEATHHAGGGKLILTGSLGDIMKESAQAALTYLHARAGDFGIPEEAFSRSDIHVHVPAGAVPKDGPSAGSAISTALASLLTGHTVRDYLSMTGEITLRGNILPVGGIKEKCLAAQRAGIKTILLPETNRDDFDELPEEVRKQIEFHFVERIDDILPLALKKWPGKSKSSSKGKATSKSKSASKSKSSKGRKPSGSKNKKKKKSG